MQIIQYFFAYVQNKKAQRFVPLRLLMLVILLLSVSIALNEFQQFLHGFFLRDVLENTLFAFVKRNAILAGADIAVIGIRHFAGTVDNTAHDGDFEIVQDGLGLFGIV